SAMTSEPLAPRWRLFAANVAQPIALPRSHARFIVARARPASRGTPTAVSSISAKRSQLSGSSASQRLLHSTGLAQGLAGSAAMGAALDATVEDTWGTAFSVGPALHAAPIASAHPRTTPAPRLTEGV